MTATNIHMYVLVAPLLGALAVSLFGRKREGVVGPISLVSLAISLPDSSLKLSSTVDPAVELLASMSTMLVRKRRVFFSPDVCPSDFSS